MKKVNFYESVDNSLLKYAVIVSKYNGKWVFCNHRERDTYECPGGRREVDENIDDTAKRELWEETGAAVFALTRICAYSVTDGDSTEKNALESFGMLYFAEISSLGELPAFEIERIELFDTPPCAWTYPEIQPKLLEKVSEFFSSK